MASLLTRICNTIMTMTTYDSIETSAIIATYHSTAVSESQSPVFSLLCSYVGRCHVWPQSDHTIHQPSFDLPRHTCYLLNHLWTGQSICHANLHGRCLAKSAICKCSQQT